MNTLIPNRFLIDLEFPLRYRDPPPPLDGGLAGWTDAELLPRLGAMDGLGDFADVWACWNERGLYLACRVDGKSGPPRCDPKVFWQSDHLRLCTDTRDARDIRRASRYCQQFYFLPCGGKGRGSGGGGRGSSGTGDAPAAGSARFQRAREHAPAIDERSLVVASRVLHDAWQLEAHIPARALSGFDPAEHPRIGMFTMVEDRERGQQPLTIGDDLYWYVDPSTWATAVLAR